MGTTRCGPVSVFVRVTVKTGFRMQHPLENAILKIQDVGWLMYLRGPFFVIMRCRDFSVFQSSACLPYLFNFCTHIRLFFFHIWTRKLAS